MINSLPRVLKISLINEFVDVIHTLHVNLLLTETIIWNKIAKNTISIKYYYVASQPAEYYSISLNEKQLVVLGSPSLFIIDTLSMKLPRKSLEIEKIFSKKNYEIKVQFP